MNTRTSSTLPLGSLALVALLTVATAGWAQESRVGLSFPTARRIADGCEAFAKAKGWRMVIAVDDEGANLKYLARMDDSFLVSLRIAQDKAATSARAPVSTRKWGELSTGTKGLDLVPGTVSFAGGLPIFAAGHHIGGIGVSGGTQDEDELCAQAGLDGVKDLLK